MMKGPSTRFLIRAVLLLIIMLDLSPTLAEVGEPRNRPILFSLDAHSSSSARIYSIDANGFNLRPLTSLMNAAVNPVSSPDGKRIVFNAHAANDTEIIYLMNSDGTEQKALTDDKMFSARPVWSPDGKRIAFECKRNDADQGFQVCVKNLDGANVKLLTTTDDNREPAWSHDGKKLAYLAFNPKSYFPDLYTINVDGSEPTRVPISITIQGFGSPPSWSPDDSHIIVVGGVAKRLDVYSVAADGTGATNLTERFPGDSILPVWSPDGRYMAFKTGFTAGDDQLLALGVTEFAGNTPKITQWFGPGGGFYDLAWSPDSSQLAFISHADDPGNAGIYILTIACLFDASGCSEKDVVKYGISGSDWPAFLYWAYSPAIAPQTSF